MLYMIKLSHVQENSMKCILTKTPWLSG